jgi:hypothetical protein
MVFLLILLTPLLYSQSSSEPSNESMTCYTQSELAALEANLQKVVEEAVVEAVNEAVQPYKIQVEILDKDLVKMEHRRNGWRLATFITISVGAITTLVAVLVR